MLMRDHQGKLPLHLAARSGALGAATALAAAMVMAMVGVLRCLCVLVNLPCGQQRNVASHLHT
jgi:hypothetical protein